MNKLIQNIRKIDFFSVTYSPAISDGLNYNHSSVFGGIISLLIAILSLMYGIYYIYIWWTYQLLPKVTSDINKFSENDDFGQIMNSITVKPAYQQGWSPINPFKRDEIILQPLIIDLDDSEIIWQPLLSNEQINDVLTINLEMNYTKQYYIIFTLCKEDYLLDHQKCASEEAKNLYFQQLANSLYIEISFTTINPSTFEPQTFERTYPINIHSQAEMCSSIILHYQMNHYLIDRAFLFSTGQEEHNLISNSLNYPQYSLKDYCDKQFLPNTFGAFFVLFQQQYSTVQIAYPPISEVFAAIGSIISILFSVKFVITLLNLQQLRQDVLDDIMTQYYPEIKQFQIIKNLFGKITQVKFKGIPVEISSYIGFQKQIHLQMACKLNYKNLLYEMSRFQFIILSMKRRIEIEKVHTIGIKVPIQLSESGDQYTITQGEINQLNTINLRNINQSESKYDILTMKDALILSYDYKTIETNLLSQSKRSPNENNKIEEDFYYINRIEAHEYRNEEV